MGVFKEEGNGPGEEVKFFVCHEDRVLGLPQNTLQRAYKMSG